MRTDRILLAALLPALLLTGAATAQDVPLDLELGYRWTDVSGNEDMFRNQVNEREGFQIRALSYGLGDIRGTNAIDHFRIDAADPRAENVTKRQPAPGKGNAANAFFLGEIGAEIPIGRALVEQAERWAGARGPESLVVRSNTLRTESHRFYPTLGFTASKTQAVYQKPLRRPSSA